MHLAYRRLGKLQVLEYRLTVNRVDNPISVRELVGVRHNIDIGKQTEVDVDQGRMNPDRSPSHRNAKRAILEP